MMKSKEDLLQVREHAVIQMNAYACRILVCSGTGCIATGSEKIYEKFVEICKDATEVDGKEIILEFAPHDAGEHAHVGVKRTGCQGICELGPLVRIQKGDKVIQYTKVGIADCQEIFDKTVVGDDVIERLLYKRGRQGISSFIDI